MNPQTVKQVPAKPEQSGRPLVIKVSQERSTRDPMPCTWIIY